MNTFSNKEKKIYILLFKKLPFLIFCNNTVCDNNKLPEMAENDLYL